MLDTTPAPSVAEQSEDTDIPETPVATATPPDDKPRVRRLRPPRIPRADLVPVALLTLAALYLFGHLVTGPSTHYLTNSTSDQTQFCWWLEWVAKAVPHGMNPLHITDQNAPIGFNGMGNTMVLALSVAAIPLTLLFGSAATYVLLLVGGVAVTAIAWYWLFSRFLVRSRVAATLAAALCSYGPPMASHANGHVNIVVHFAIPLIIGTVLRLVTEGKVLRRGLIIGLLASVQLLIGEEVLLFAALGFGAFLVILGAQRWGVVRAAWPRTVLGLLVAGAVTLAATGYMLWYQFFGPQHYKGLPYLYWYSSDVTALYRLPANSLGGNKGSLLYSFNGAAEQNAFFGLPLLVLAALLVVWLWRDAVVRSAALVGAVFAILSLGTYITVNNHYTGHAGLWLYLHTYPLLDSLTPARFTFVSTVMLAVLLARGVDRISGLLPVAAKVGIPVRPIAAVVLVMALLPIAPLPLPTQNWPKVPAFFTDGTWHRYVDEGGTVVAVPITRTPDKTAGLNWQLATDLHFRIAGGYFLGPWDADQYGGDQHGWFNAKPRATSTLLDMLADSGIQPAIGAAQRADAATDLRYWQAQLIVLDPTDVKYPAQLKSAVDDLVGPGTFVDGVWVWPVRAISGA